MVTNHGLPCLLSVGRRHDPIPSARHLSSPLRTARSGATVEAFLASAVTFRLYRFAFTEEPHLCSTVKPGVVALGAGLLVLTASACGGEGVDPVAHVTSTSAASTTTTMVATTSTNSTLAPTTTPTTTTQSGPLEIMASVESGSVESGGRIQVVLDTNVRLIVTADVADKVHIHGYDLFFDVPSGTATDFEFVADIPGIFEVEMESSGLVLVELVVGP